MLNSPYTLKSSARHDQNKNPLIEEQKKWYKRCGIGMFFFMGISDHNLINVLIHSEIVTPLIRSADIPETVQDRASFQPFRELSPAHASLSVMTFSAPSDDIIDTRMSKGITVVQSLPSWRLAFPANCRSSEFRVTLNSSELLNVSQM